MVATHLRAFAWTTAALLSAGAFLPARAQDPDDLQRGVARISLMNGDVSVRRGDSGDWVAGVINAPLLTDDHISTGPNSRAEIQFDSSNMIRLGGNAEIHLADLQSNRYQLELAHGTATFRVLRATGANIEVDTPSISVRPSKVGSYRISVNADGETQVMARAGDIEIFTPRGSQWISSGQMMIARGNPSDPEFQIVGAPGSDDWDRWNQDRDRHFMQSTSYQYVDPSSSGVYGTEDLDAYGTWTDVPNYGYVWRPTVAVDWAPYRQGRWVWEDWYGWTWVSYDPWGWAPYHYGRWFFDAGFGWCWYPGMRGFHHYWSPALVGWFGWGGGVGFGFGFGNVGWVPLAPFETFHPWWGRGFYGRPGFGRNINITNVNITNIYRNARVGNGVSGMPAGDFREGRFHSVGRVSGDQIRSAGMVRGQMPIAPTNANLHFSNRQASFTPQGSSNNTRFFSHQQANAAPRIPFSQQQRAMGVPESNIRGSAAPNIERRGQMNNSPQLNNSPQPMRPSQNGPSSGGAWSRFGEPSRGSFGNNAAPRGQALENTRPQQQAPSNGFQRFGVPNTRPPASESPRYNAPRYSAPEPRNAPSYSAPRYSAPEPRSAPSYSAPRYSAPSAPRYSAPAPRSAPSFSAPRGGGGGGGMSRPSGGGGGGGSRPSGGGGGGSRGRR